MSRGRNARLREQRRRRELLFDIDLWTDDLDVIAEQLDRWAALRLSHPSDSGQHGREGPERVKDAPSDEG